MKAPKGSGKAFEKHPEGQATVVCTKIIDKGTVFSPVKNKDVHKILLYFESSKLMTEGEYSGKPFLLFASFNYSMFQNSAMCKFIEQWRGKKFKTQEEADDFDISKVLGNGGFVNVEHNGDFVNISSIMPIPEGMTQPIPVGDMLIWDFDAPKMAVFEKLSESIQKQLKQAKEWRDFSEKGQPSESENPADGMDSEIPF